MHSEYDENLRQNPFFKEMIERHSDIIKKTAEEHWIICIPRRGTIELHEISVNTILDQVLIPQEDGILKGCQTCTTLSKKKVQIRKNQIITDDCQFFSNTVCILFKETFYEGKGKKFTMWCIDRPLFSEYPSCSSENLQVLESLPDCIDFLWVESLCQDVLQQIQNLCTKFIETTSNYELEHIQTQKDLIGSLYSKCLQKALRNTNLRSKATDNDQFLEKLKLAVETYMQHCLDKKILFGISTFLVQSDAQVNKIVKYSESISDETFGISTVYSDALISAKFELSKLNSSSTILDKVNCLDRTFTALCGNKNSGHLITSDDVLQMFVYLILRVNIYNWESNLRFIQDFKFCSSTFTDHVHYLLTTLEAAIEFIKSSLIIDMSDGIKQNIVSKNEIFNFVLKGDLLSLKKLFENSNDTELREKLCHPLCLCDTCEKITKSILIDKEIRNEKDQTLLIHATICEQTEIIEYLLSYEVNVNSQDYLGRSALHYAAERGYQDIILLLVSNNNVNVNILDNNKNTPLHLAAGIAHENCVKALIYSSPNLLINIVNNCNETPLHLAAKAGYFSIVKILLENSPLDFSDTHIRSVLSKCHNFAIRNYIEQFSIKKVLPFLVYSKSEHALDENNLVTNFGIKPRTEDDLKKINLLIKAIKNNDLPLTCFYLGFDHSKHEDFLPKCHPLCNCEKCLKLGVDNLDTSAESENDNLPKLESPEEINVNMCNSEGFTPLHIACQYGRSTILRILLDCGSQVNFQSYKHLYTPLHLACLFQQITIVKELMKCSNCDVNIRDCQGNTPLFYACSNNDSRIIEILLKNDAAFDLKNKMGNTVWDICQKKMLYQAFKALKNNTQYSCASSTYKLCS